MKNHLEKLAAFFDNKKMNSYKKEVVKIAKRGKEAIRNASKKAKAKA